MSPAATSSIVLAFIVVAAALGALLRAVLPQEHLSPESKEAIKLTIGLVGSMVALIIGLLVWSAKSFYDTQSAELTKVSAQAVLLDRMLAEYGPDAKPARDLLRTVMVRTLERTWSNQAASSSTLVPESGRTEAVYRVVQQLSPRNEMQCSIQANAISLMNELGQERWLMYEQTVTGIPRQLMAIMIFWLCLLFLSFGLLAPPNRTVAASLFLSAVSVSAAVLMMLEMYSPYQGLIQVSSAPLQGALAHLGK